MKNLAPALVLKKIEANGNSEVGVKSAYVSSGPLDQRLF